MVSIYETHAEMLTARCVGGCRCGKQQGQQVRHSHPEGQFGVRCQRDLEGDLGPAGKNRMLEAANCLFDASCRPSGCGMLAHPIDATATELQLPETPTRQSRLVKCKLGCWLKIDALMSRSKQATTTEAGWRPCR
jgi:hypothetical protein